MNRTILILIFAISVHILAFVFIKDHGLMMDEHEHYPQIYRFMRGNFQLEPNLPMAPGYHAVIAAVSNLVGLPNLSYYTAYPFVRLISFIFSIFGIGIFFLIAKSIEPKTALIRTLQYSFFPPFFTFFFILYTDLFSLAVLLLGFLFTIKKRLLWAGIFSAVSVMFRQNNIIWIMFFAVFAYIEKFKFRLSRANIKDFVKRGWPFVLAIFAFLGVIIAFKGPSAGVNAKKYVYFTLVSPNNLFLGLFLYFFLFLPVNAFRIGEMIKALRKYFRFLPVVLVLFLIFQNYFRIEHPYNHGAFFIHNAILEFFTETFWTKAIFFFFVFLAVVFLSVTKLVSRSQILLYPFALLFYLPLWFIEPRYSFVPMTLILLFRSIRNTSGEYILVLYFLLLSLFVYYGVFNWRFFP